MSDTPTTTPADDSPEVTAFRDRVMAAATAAGLPAELARVLSEILAPGDRVADKITDTTVALDLLDQMKLSRRDQIDVTVQALRAGANNLDVTRLCRQHGRDVSAMKLSLLSRSILPGGRR